MKTRTMLALGFLSLLAPSLFGQTDTSPVSEEARKHFVMGSALAKDAKTVADFSQVVSEFKRAVELAPQLPEARYNLAKAREAAGDYSGAMADLKRYQQFKLSDSEARMVQDKIYALEAKTGAAAEKQKQTNAQANSSEAKSEKFFKSLDGGVWRCEHSSSFQSNTGGHWVDQRVGHTYIAVRGHRISGYDFTRPIIGSDHMLHGVARNVDYDPSATPFWTATLTSRKFNAPRPTTIAPDTSSYRDEVAISDDGQSITETSTCVYSWGRVTGTTNYVRLK